MTIGDRIKPGAKHLPGQDPAAASETAVDTDARDSDRPEAAAGFEASSNETSNVSS
jgi:hypothetical protein